MKFDLFGFGFLFFVLRLFHSDLSLLILFGHGNVRNGRDSFVSRSMKGVLVRLFLFFRFRFFS